MTELEGNISARESILRSIRQHLAASAPHDLVDAEEESPRLMSNAQPIGNRQSSTVGEDNGAGSLTEIFRSNLEAVGGHSVLARGEAEVLNALNGIVSSLQSSSLRGTRIALSDAALLERLISRMDASCDEIAVTPSGQDLFEYDIGVSMAQGAIAETGTLVLDSEAEKHRLVSLVPPVHIAIVDAASICLTLGEALAAAEQSSPLSPTITLVTGPSRTADIELTLAIGVHGPQELYVIINEGPALTTSKTKPVTTTKGPTR